MPSKPRLEPKPSASSCSQADKAGLGGLRLDAEPVTSGTMKLVQKIHGRFTWDGLCHALSLRYFRCSWLIRKRVFWLCNAIMDCWWRLLPVVFLFLLCNGLQFCLPVYFGRSFLILTMIQVAEVVMYDQLMMDGKTTFIAIAIVITVSSASKLQAKAGRWMGRNFLVNNSVFRGILIHLKIMGMR